MSVSRAWFRRTAAALVGAAMLTAMVGVAPADARAPAVVVTDYRYYQAVVNLPPDGPTGFAGSVSFQSIVGGVVSVNVDVTRAITVDCADGQDIASFSITTDGREATEPGPVSLDINSTLRTARGDAVVDLTQTESPGCGGPETTTRLPAQVVSLDVTGTSVRFRTGINSWISSGPNREVSRVYDLSRDGTGSVSLGSILTNAASDGSFLKYAVEHRRTRGTTPTPPANAAPAGGTGATGAFTTSFEPAGGLGVVLDDVSVTASTSAPPERATTIDAVGVRHTMVACPGGGTAVVEVGLFGAGPGSLTIDKKLSVAQVSGTVQATRVVIDGCDPGSEPVESVVTIPVSLSLHATGPAVRVRDVFYQVTPGQGEERTTVAYVARDAAGTVTVSDVSGATGLASISKASP